MTRQPMADANSGCAARWRPVLSSRVGPLRVDLRALLSLRHRFDPDACKARGCCCASYEITLRRHEMERVAGYLPLAVRHQHALAGTNPFDPSGDGEWALDTDEDGRCVFAFVDGDGHTWCSIHRAAMELGLNPYRAKPRSCALWPLALSEDSPPLLTVMEDAWDFPCNSRRAAATELDPGVADTLEQVFGLAFLRRVQDAVPADD